MNRVYRTSKQFYQIKDQTVVMSIWMFHRKMAGRPMTSVKKFAQKYNLGDPLYGSFYQAEYDEYSEELSKVLYG